MEGVCLFNRGFLPPEQGGSGGSAPTRAELRDMEIKDGVVLAGLDPCMRPAMVNAERIWKRFGRSEGVTITSGLDGCHSAGSLHYYGLALDFRTHYFTAEMTLEAVFRLRECLAFDHR